MGISESDSRDFHCRYPENYANKRQIDENKSQFYYENESNENQTNKRCTSLRHADLIVNAALNLKSVIIANLEIFHSLTVLFSRRMKNFFHEIHSHKSLANKCRHPYCFVCRH